MRAVTYGAGTQRGSHELLRVVEIYRNFLAEAEYGRVDKTRDPQRPMPSRCLIATHPM